MQRWHIWAIKLLMAGTVFFGLVYFFLVMLQCTPSKLYLLRPMTGLLTRSSYRILEQSSRFKQMLAFRPHFGHHLRPRRRERGCRLGIWYTPLIHRLGSGDEVQNQTPGRWHPCICCNR